MSLSKMLGLKSPKMDMGPMNEALKLINKQSLAIEDYFKAAGQEFETQYSGYYGREMQDAVNALALRGIYESPVSERALGRTRAALAETYATGKSELAAQKMAATSAVEQQRIAYYQNLAQMKYQQALAKQQSKLQMTGMLTGIGASLL